MATKNGSLEQALAILIQNQALFVAGAAESERRFSRIERDLEQIKKLLMEHSEIMSGLTDAIRQKIGFKSK